MAKRNAGSLAVVAAILLLPLVATIVTGTSGVNLSAGMVLIAAALVLVLRFEVRWPSVPSRRVAGGLLALLGVFVAAWEWQVGEVWLNTQLLLYLGIAASLPALTSWFSKSGEDGALMLFELKLGAVIGSSLLMLAAVWSLPDDPGALQNLIYNPPIYGHLRHFNDDQLPAIALAFYFASLAKERNARVAWFIVLAGMGFLMAWSGGRGVMLSVGVYLALVATFRILPYRAIALGCGALALGALLVFLHPQTDLFLRLFFKWSGSLNNISSNRLAIWLASIDAWRENWLSIIFGFGPDAMRTTVRAFPGIHQPHNAFIQMLIEFGLIGLCAFTAAVVLIARRVLATLRTHHASSEARVAAALLTAYGVYMLNDGIIYHAVPLTTVMLLTAYLLSVKGGNSDAARAGVSQASSQPSDQGR